MAQAYKQAYTRYMPQLVKSLPMNDPYFIAELSAKHLLPGNMEATIQSKPTAADKSSCFLTRIIKPAIDNEFTDSFDKLLIIMENCEYLYVQELAGKIKADITTNGPNTGGQSGPVAAAPPVPTSFDFDAANAKVTENYVKLSELPINSILGALLAKKVILPKQKEEMEAIPIESKRMEYLLDKVIYPSLNLEFAIKFKGLLEVMEESKDVMFISMARKLGGSAAVPSC